MSERRGEGLQPEGGEGGDVPIKPGIS